VCYERVDRLFLRKSVQILNIYCCRVNVFNSNLCFWGRSLEQHIIKWVVGGQLHISSGGPWHEILITTDTENMFFRKLSGFRRLILILNFDLCLLQGGSVQQDSGRQCHCSSHAHRLLQTPLRHQPHVARQTPRYVPFFLPGETWLMVAASVLCA